MIVLATSYLGSATSCITARPQPVKGASVPKLCTAAAVMHIMCASLVTRHLGITALMVHQMSELAD